MKELNLVIKRCFDCPYLQGFWCTKKVKQTIRRLAIPKWCPLEDMKAEE